MKLKDLRIAYNVLDELGTSVPRELLVHLADRIRQTEATLQRRRINRMSDEDLLKLENKQKRTLRVNTPDGRLFQKKTNEETFRHIMQEADLVEAHKLSISLRRKPLLFFDETLHRRRIRGYVYLRDGYFLLAKSTTAEKISVLTRIDEEQQLNWEILLV